MEFLNQNFIKAKGLSKIKEIMDEKRANKIVAFRNKLTEEDMIGIADPFKSFDMGPHKDSIQQRDKDISEIALNNQSKKIFRLEESLKQDYYFKE